MSCGSDIASRESTQLPLQEVINRLGIPKYLFQQAATHFDQQSRAYQYYREVKQLMDRGETPESLKKKQPVMFEDVKERCRKER